MKKLIKNMVLSLVAVVVMTVSAGNFTVSAAAGRAEAALLYVTGYEVTNESITPGSDFTLTVKLENFSSSVTARNVIVVITNPVGVAPEYGTVSQAYVKSVGPGDTTEVSFRYTAEATIQATQLNFTAYVTSDSFTTNAEMRIPVGRAVDFEVVDCILPEKIAVNKTEYVSAMIENLGSTGVSNVVMVVRCDGEVMASANIGTMSAGTSKTQSVGISFAEEGQHTLELLLTYTNSDGMNKEYVISSNILKVVAEETKSDAYGEQTVAADDANQTQNTQSGIGVGNIIMVCISGLLLISVCCVILLLIYRRK